MSPESPLDNKKILIPRGEKQAKSFSALVRKYGGVPVEIPLIAFRPVPISEESIYILNELHTYDWVIFTSKVTVETFFSFLNGKVHSFPKIAVIGQKTEQVLKEMGYQVDFKPGKYVAEEFTEEFLPFVQSGSRVLIPKGNLARDYIASSLVKKGAHVDEMIVYETFFPEESKQKLIMMLEQRQMDVLTFTSPSTIDHFMKVVEEEGLSHTISDCVIACIGPVTKVKAETYGLPVHVMPTIYTVNDMLKSVMDYINKTK